MGFWAVRTLRWTRVKHQAKLTLLARKGPRWASGVGGLLVLGTELNLFLWTTNLAHSGCSHPCLVSLTPPHLAPPCSLPPQFLEHLSQFMPAFCFTCLFAVSLPSWELACVFYLIPGGKQTENDGWVFVKELLLQPFGGGIVIILPLVVAIVIISPHPCFISKETEAEWLKDLVKVAQESLKVETQTQDWQFSRPLLLV